MLKNALLIILFSSLTFTLTACDKLPPAPEYWQWGLRNDEMKMYGTNSKTKEQVIAPISDVMFMNAQCFTLDDFNNLQNYISELKRLAQKHCK